MQLLVDIDSALADGTISSEAASELKRRARETMVSYAVNLALFIGVVMVIGGAIAWLESRSAQIALGSVLTIAGAAVLTSGATSVRMIANATTMIGATLALGAATSLAFEDQSAHILLGTAIGLPAALLGWWMRRAVPETLSVAGGWIFLLGATIHVAGVVTTESELGLEWLALHYAAVIALACGFLLDIRFVTATAIVPLAVALSSRAFYSHASYGVAIYEATLTILQMSAIAGLALLVSIRFGERIARHGRIMGQLALIWANMAFWIGSLWGDVVGLYLWGPRWAEVTRDLPEGVSRYNAWSAAIEKFEATSLEISPDVFAAVWALGILGVGAWAASTARRAVLNIAVTFGGIHFYTQYFERLEATPGAIVVAGVIAILAAWGLWIFNRKLSSKPG